MANLYSAAKTPRSHVRRPPPLTPARPQHLLPRGARVIPTIAAQRASAAAKTTTPPAQHSPRRCTLPRPALLLTPSLATSTSDSANLLITARWETSAARNRRATTSPALAAPWAPHPRPQTTPAHPYPPRRRARCKGTAGPWADQEGVITTLAVRPRKLLRCACPLSPLHQSAEAKSS